MKRTHFFLISFLSLALCLSSCSRHQTDSPQRLQSLRKELEKDLLLARSGKGGNVEELRKRIAGKYKEAFASEPNPQARTQYLLSEAGLVSSLPKSSVHNNYHQRNLINNFGKQGIKLSGDLLRSRRQDPRWSMRDMAGAISLMDSRKDEAPGSPEAELALARTYLVLGRTSALLNLARNQWGMTDLKGDSLYGLYPPFFEGLGDKPYETLRKRRSDDANVKLKTFRQWLRKASTKPSDETIKLSFSFQGKPLKGVHVLLFPEENPRYLAQRRPYAARYPGAVMYDWAMFGSEPVPDGTDSIAAVFPLRWAVSGDNGAIVFGDLPAGKYRAGDVLYDEAIFNDAWPNHAPDTSLHDVTFLALKDKATGSFPEIRFVRAPMIEADELQFVSPDDKTLRWKLRTPSGWGGKKVMYRVMVQPALSARRFAEELDVWSIRAVEVNEPEAQLSRLMPGLQEGLYRFKIAIMMNNSVVHETNTGLLVVTRGLVAGMKESLAKLQEAMESEEGLRAFGKTSTPGLLSWYAKTELLTVLMDQDPKEAKRLREEILKQAPKGHFLSQYVEERFRFLSK